jgi:hypothetical protein
MTDKPKKGDTAMLEDFKAGLAQLFREGFTAGAKAQRGADLERLKAMRDEMPDDRRFEEYDEDEKDEIQNRSITIDEVVIRLGGHPSGVAAAPLVKFEDQDKEIDN